MQMSSSDQQQVNIEDVTLESGGRYRCEVSAEAPHFQTVSDRAEMSIVGNLLASLIPFYSAMCNAR